MFVGRICDEGHNITFDAVMAMVRSKDGEGICRFHGNHSGLHTPSLNSDHLQLFWFVQE